MFFGVQLISVCWRICYVKVKNMMLAGFILLSIFSRRPPYIESCRRFVTTAMTDNQIPHNWSFPFNDAIVCLRVAMATCANAAENVTTSEALVRKQLLPTLHLCFKGILTDGFYYLIVFWTFVDLHCWLRDVKAQQRLTNKQVNTNAVTCF